VVTATLSTILLATTAATYSTDAYGTTIGRFCGSNGNVAATMQILWWESYGLCLCKQTFPQNSMDAGFPMARYSNADSNRTAYADSSGTTSPSWSTSSLTCPITNPNGSGQSATTRSWTVGADSGNNHRETHCAPQGRSAEGWPRTGGGSECNYRTADDIGLPRGPDQGIGGLQAIIGLNCFQDFHRLLTTLNVSLIGREKLSIKQQLSFTIDKTCCNKLSLLCSHPNTPDPADPMIANFSFSITLILTIPKHTCPAIPIAPIYAPQCILSTQRTATIQPCLTIYIAVCIMNRVVSTGWSSLLLALSGDIHPNPGPPPYTVPSFYPETVLRMSSLQQKGKNPVQKSLARRSPPRVAPTHSRSATLLPQITLLPSIINKVQKEFVDAIDSINAAACKRNGFLCSIGMQLSAFEKLPVLTTDWAKHARDPHRLWVNLTKISSNHKRLALMLLHNKGVLGPIDSVCKWLPSELLTQWCKLVKETAALSTISNNQPLPIPLCTNLARVCHTVFQTTSQINALPWNSIFISCLSTSNMPQNYLLRNFLKPVTWKEPMNTLYIHQGMDSSLDTAALSTVYENMVLHPAVQPFRMIILAWMGQCLQSTCLRNLMCSGHARCVIRVPVCHFLTKCQYIQRMSQLQEFEQVQYLGCWVVQNNLAQEKWPIIHAQYINMFKSCLKGKVPKVFCHATMNNAPPTRPTLFPLAACRTTSLKTGVPNWFEFATTTWKNEQYEIQKMLKAQAEIRSNEMKKDRIQWKVIHESMQQSLSILQRSKCSNFKLHKLLRLATVSNFNMAYNTECRQENGCSQNKAGFVYILMNPESKFAYVGQSLYPKQRLAEHYAAAAKSENKCLLYRAMRNTGIGKFMLIPVEYTSQYKTVTLLNSEKEWFHRTLPYTLNSEEPGKGNCFINKFISAQYAFSAIDSWVSNELSKYTVKGAESVAEQNHVKVDPLLCLGLVNKFAKVLSEHAKNKLLQKSLRNIKRKYGIHKLKRRFTCILEPTSCNQMREYKMKIIKSIQTNPSLPEQVKLFILNRLYIVQKSPRKILQVLGMNKGVKSAVEELLQLVPSVYYKEKPLICQVPTVCTCRNKPGFSNHKHVFCDMNKVENLQPLSHIPHLPLHLLTNNLKDKLKDSVCPQKNTCKVIRFIRQLPFNAQYMCLNPTPQPISLTTLQQQATATTLFQGNIPYTVAQFRNMESVLRKNDLYVAELCKSPHHGKVTCKSVLLLAYAQCFKWDQKNFTSVSSHNTHEEATNYVMSVLRAHSAEVFGRKKWKGSQVPTARPLIKSKSEFETSGELKVRPLISQYRHPWKGGLKVISRCIALVIRCIVTDFRSECWEQIRMDELKSVVAYANLKLESSLPWSNQLLNSKPNSEIVCAEDDIVGMFNNIDVDFLIDGLNAALEWLSGKVRSTMRRNLEFKISKLNKKLDTVGHSSDSLHYILVSKEQIISTVIADIKVNNLFVIGNTIYKQNKGVQQGGFLSSNLACLACILKERMANKINILPKQSISSRFRDNINSILRLDEATKVYWSGRLQSLRNIYDMECTQENISDTSTANWYNTLENVIFNTPSGIFCALASKTVCIPSPSNSKAIPHFVSRNSFMCEKDISTIVPGRVAKAVSEFSCVNLMNYNMATIILDLWLHKYNMKCIAKLIFSCLPRFAHKVDIQEANIKEALHLVKELTKYLSRTECNTEQEFIKGVEVVREYLLSNNTNCLTNPHMEREHRNQNLIILRKRFEKTHTFQDPLAKRVTVSKNAISLVDSLVLHNLATWSNWLQQPKNPFNKFTVVVN